MPKTIIVPLDGSRYAERALPAARTLAEQCDATVALVMARLGGDSEPERYLEGAAHRGSIESARTVVVPDLLASTALPMLAESEPDAVICMTTHGRTGPGKAICGSIAEEVLLRSRRPVVLVGPAVADAPARFTRYVACVDDAGCAASRIGKDAQLAHDLDAPLWLVHVADPHVRIDPGPLELDSVESASLQRLARALADTYGTVNWDVLHGEHVARAIVDYVRPLDAPLLSLTTHGRRGLARLVAGSVATTVVHLAPCPVVLHHAPGTAL